MPYRRLPNTDKARLKALKIARFRGRELPPFKLAFSQKSNQRLQSFVHNYENAISYYNHCYALQTEKNKQYIASMKKAKLYISHFIKVLNLAVTRGDIQSEARKYLGLNINESRLPPLNAENEIIKWGEKLIKGEAHRILDKGTPVTNPTIALVKVRYEAFMETHHYQKTLQKNTARALEKLTELRKEADMIILQVWNEVEDSFKDLPDEMKRAKAKEYGLIYVYRKNELGVISIFDSRQSGAG